MRISDWSSDVCSSDLQRAQAILEHLERLAFLERLVERGPDVLQQVAAHGLRHGEGADMLFLPDILPGETEGEALLAEEAQRLDRLQDGRDILRHLMRRSAGDLRSRQAPISRPRPGSPPHTN